MKKMVLVPYDQYIARGKITPVSSHGLDTGTKLLSESNQDASHVSLHNEKNKMSKDSILHSISPNKRRKAESLLRYIEQNMNWNEKGELITDDITHTGSHLTDLLEDALGKSSNSHVKASEAFYTKLKHAPKSLFHSSKTDQIGKGVPLEEEKKVINQNTSKNPTPPPPGIPVHNKPIDLMDPSIWTNKWKKI